MIRINTDMVPKEGKMDKLDVERMVRAELLKLGVKKALVDKLSHKEASDLLQALVQARKSCLEKK